MPTSNVLSQLRDIQMPAAVSGWPNAPGWYILGVLIALGLFVVIYKLYKKYYRERAKKLALRELAELRKEFQQKGYAGLAMIKLSRLIRRTALAYYPRKDVAALTGKAWLAFLDTSSGSKEFSNGVGKILVTAPYQGGKPSNPDQLLDLVSVWIKHV